MGNLEKALRYPFGQPGWGVKFLIGGGINLLGALLGLIPYLGIILWLCCSFFPWGYAYRVLQDTLLSKEEPLPPWEKWRQLFSRGFWVFLISLAYAIIPGFFYWLGKNLWYSGGLAAFIGVFSLILGIGLGLIAFFLLPMALVLFAAHGELLGTAFHWRTIVEKIWLIQKDYFISWLATLVLYWALHFLRMEIPFFGLIFYSFALFYLSVALAYLFGLICQEVVKEDS